jgi:hypothetical protein
MVSNSRKNTMASSFNIDFPGSANEFVVNANKAIQTKGGVFEGNHEAGNFSLKTLILTLTPVFT